MRLDEETRRDFPILERVVNGRPLVYLDSAASSQRPRTVLEAMVRYYERSHANVHRSIHTLGEEATELYETARDRVQRFMGAPSREEIVFTRGTTDGLNLVADAIGHTLRPGDEILITEMEHHSNIIPWQMAARLSGAVVRAVPLAEPGAAAATLDLDALDRLLGPRTRVLAFTHVSNVLGTVLPVDRLAGLARDRGVLTVVDGAQAAPHMQIDMSALQCDFYVYSAHKMLGPTGIGVLYGRRDLLERLEPTRGGGEMIKEVWIDRAQWNDLPWRFEPGTPPIAEAVGLTAAIEYLEKLGMARVAEHERALTSQAIAELSRIPGVTVYGPPPGRERGAVVSFTVEDLHPHDVAALLDAEGIAVRAGHHCAMPLMRRLGVVGTSRASFSVFTSPEEVSLLARAVAGLGSAL
jgi:cysteine desulfurase/selenocysteine lyase